MAVTKERAGKYRQLVATIRFARPGAGEIESSRPRKGGTDGGPFIDSDAEPTLIEFAEGDPLDVDALLATGAIAPIVAAAPEVEPLDQAEAEAPVLGV